MQSTNTDVLFSTSAVTQANQPPVIVIGLPRSGSSFLAHVTSHLKDWFIFDDLYLYREAKAIDAINTPLTSKQLDRLLFFLGWQIRARIKFGVFCVPKMDLTDVDLMNDALKKTFNGKSIYWYELQEEWMTRLCINQGCMHWGYKAPQDFQNIEILDKAYPGVKYIFLYRDPKKMLRSLKFVRDQDGNPNQYHPIIYSIYWKKALSALNHLTNINKDRVLAVKYENLVANVDSQADIIAKYLNSSISKPIKTDQTNSSFSNQNKTDITPTEKKICELLTGEYLEKLGYSNKEGQFRFRDIFDLFKTSITFTSYQIKRITMKKSSRVSILLFLKNLIKS